MLQKEPKAAFRTARAKSEALREFPQMAAHEDPAEVWLGAAANGGSEPLVTDTALCSNVRFSSAGQKRAENKLGFAKVVALVFSLIL